MEGDLFVRWFRSVRFGLSLLKSRLDTDAASAAESDAALSPRRATYFSLLRQRNLRKRKATLVPASLRFAAGNLRCSAQPGSRSNSLRSDNRGPLFVWASAPRRIHKGLAEMIGIGFGAKFSMCNAPVFVAAYARSTSARGRNRLRTRRTAWFLGSDHNFAAQHPQGKPKARRIHRARRRKRHGSQPRAAARRHLTGPSATSRRSGKTAAGR